MPIYQRAFHVYQIMRCTGHKTEDSFLLYLKLDGKDYALKATESAFFKSKPQKASLGMLALPKH